MHDASGAIAAKASPAGRRCRTMLMLSCGPLALVAAQPAAAQAIDALPTGGTVVAGTATIGTPSPSSRLDISQTSNRAIFEWSSFDIGQNAEVAFAQPSASAIAVNRITGGTAPSQIAGKLTANGVVAVLNANGVLFAGTADVNVGGLIASTGDIENAAFMAGGNLAITGATGGEIVVSAGAGITVGNAGLAAFVAPSVRNSGTITATAGRVQLGAGTAFTLDLAGDGLLQIGVGANTPLVENHGSIFASGGQIQMSARQASAIVEQTIRTGILPVGSARLDGQAIVLGAVGSDFEIASEIAGTGNLVVNANRIFGSADIDVDGELTFNVNAGGAVADTLATGDNWINDALGVIGGEVDATTIHLGAGLYRPGVRIDADNVTLDGHGVARIGWVSGIENAIDVWGDGATVRNLEIFGPATSAYTSFAWGSTNSRGVFINRFADGATVTNNTIHDIRTGIIVDGRNLGTVVTGNLIDNTKSGISVQYTDGSNVILGGNSEGVFGNEWGINVHLNGILQPDGTTINPSTSSVGGVPVGLLGTTSLAEQQRLLALRAANNGLSVQNIAYSAANRTQAYVKPTGGAVTQGSRLSPLASVQAGVNAVVTGGTVYVLPGEYSEGVTGVGYLGEAGGQKFGLHVPKSDLTILGVDANWQPIASAEDVAAYVTSLYQAGFGAQHFIAGSNVTIEGMGFRPVGTGTNKTLEVIGDNFTLRNSVVDNSGNGTAANFYISDFELAGTPRVERFTLEGNIFHGGTTASAMVVVAGGVGRTTTADNRIFAGNQLFGNGLAGRRGFQIQGRIPSVAWQLLLSGPATVIGNTFTGVDIPVRTTGILTAPLDWDGVFRGNDNIFAGGAALAYKGGTSEARGVLVSDGGETYEDIRITRGVQASIDRTLAGDTVHLLDGTYNIGSTPISITRSLSLIGQSQAGTVIDGRGVGAGLGTMQVQADDVSLSSFTLYGADSGANNYGIKVQPNPAAYSPNQRLLNFAISDVTVRGSTRAELDLNGVVGATIANFTADGRRVANDAATAGAGVQITDSANVTLSGVHTLGNAWGGVALYQANKPSAYNGQTTNITIAAAQNTFEEPLGLFSQLESTTQEFGQLNLTGFDYAVRNTDHRPDNFDSQFVFYRTSLTDAVAFAKAIGTASASSIEGYTGTAFSNVFTVADGLSINAALRDVRTGGTVNVDAGTYGETVAITKTVTLAGAGMDATAMTGGMTIGGALSGLMLRDFTVSGSGNGTSVIGNSGLLTGLAVDGVRIDGLNVANRHGFIGGQIGGAISITDSEFVNIRGWAAFDTRSGAGGNDGAQILSGTFSNNLIDDTIGHIAFRQQAGAATLPNLVFSGNTVRNVGAATNSFGAVFKAFNAGTVDFTGNTVSGVGTSGFNPAGEAAYGAVLMARGTAVLNVTSNTFTGNNQVFAVEPGRGLPDSTNFSGNSFVDNAYSIYLPAGLSGGGTIAFGAGNAFTAGANTVQHVVWRSPDALDLTGVSFDGIPAASLSPVQAFAAEDLITDGIDQGGFGLARLQAGKLFVTTASGADAALRAITLGTAGDQLNLSAGTHTLGSTLFLTKDIDVVGQGKGVTVLDASGHGSYGIRVHADDVALSGFTLSGSAAATNASYGIKVESGGAASERNTGFAISDVAIAGSRKTGLDLNAVVGATIDGVSVSGVGAGNGIAITDSVNVTVRNSSTTGNAWGGLALYQANNIAGGGSDQRLDNVTIAASNAFAEANGVYLQDSSASLSPGTISVLGYGYTVRNADHRPDGAQFTFFQKTRQNAFDYAANLASPGSSVVQGWTGSADDRHFQVGHGALSGGGQRALSLQAAFDASASGDTITVASGAYAENATLSGARSLNFGTVTLNGLTLNAAASLAGNLTLASGNFAAAGSLTLTGTTGITSATGNIALGSVSGPQALTLSGKALTLGAANLASLAATGTSIATSSVTTSGAQSYTGPTTLSGAYAASKFSVTGAATLGGATTVSTSGSLSLGTVGGAQALTLSGASVVLGAANVASLAVLGSGITTAGVTTSGAQSYSGPVTLAGAYSASVFSVSGATTLAAATTIDATGDIGLGTTSGAYALTIDGDDIALGTANLANLAVTGTRVATNGATTTGSQAYAGALTLEGTYGASSFAVNGATTLDGVTGITTIGNLALGAVAGAQSLTLKGATITIGAANLAALTATGSDIATAGVTTTGAQAYTGSLKLAGSYAASSFTATGATTIGASGLARLGPIGGARALTVSGNTVELGAVDIASLAAAGMSIATAGAITTGTQSYTGATRLAGSYRASSLSVSGATTLAAATSISTSGNIGLAAVTGPHTLALSGAGITFGTANVASMSATGNAVSAGSVTTSDGQSYAGATSLGGTYAASAFTVNGAATLTADTAITTSSDIALGTVNGAHALALRGDEIAFGAADLTSLDAVGSRITVGGVTTSGGQTYSGTTRLAGNYAASDFVVDGATILSGATAIASAGELSTGVVEGAHALTLSGVKIALGAVSAASLRAAGDIAANAGIVTQGAQSFVGNVALAGDFEASSFLVTGHSTLAGDTSVAASDITLGIAEGAHALTLNGGTITLGAANLGSLDAIGSRIATHGVNTSGDQAYVGATRLAGDYAGSSFTVDGDATLDAVTTIATSGNISMAAVDGSHGLELTGDTVSLGPISVASLTATGATIMTAGATTTDGQSYTGATRLAGNYNASSLGVNGATTLAAATGIAATDDINLVAVTGPHALTLSAAGITLGTANLASIIATGNAISAGSVTTSGGQSYAGATSLGGTYAASAFTVDGAATLTGDTVVATSADIALGAVNGAHSLTLQGDEIAVGASNIASLVAAGMSIATDGVVTSAGQVYTGATRLAGIYAGSSVTVDGDTSLDADASITASGDISLGAIGGAHGLTLAGGAISLGQADLGALAAIGDNIVTEGVVTSGAQNYVGAVTLTGDYAASGFTIDGAATLVGDIAIDVDGAAEFGSIEGAEAGAQTFTLVAESAVLGPLGQGLRLGAASITADEVVLTGSSYRAESVTFAGGEAATVRLTQDLTTFDTTPAGGSIEIAPHVLGTVNGQQSLAFATGLGAAGDGDIQLGNVGTDTVRLGDLSVTGGDFSAATVKIAGDFTSVLGGSQLFSAQTLNALGNVNATVAGNESGPIVAGGAVSVTAGGSGTGSIVAAGPVQLAYANEVAREISSQGGVSLTATGPVTGSIAATGPVAVTASGLVSAAVTTSGNATISSISGVSSGVTAGGGVNLTSSQGAVSSQVNSGGTVNVSAAGPVTGSIAASGPVDVTASGIVSTAIMTGGNASISAIAGVSSAVSAGGGVNLTSSQGAVSSQVNSGGTVNVNAVGPVTGSIQATGPVAVNASGPVSATVRTDNSANISSASGVSSQVTAGQGVQVTATQGAVTGSITAGGAVAVNAAGPVSAAVSATGAANVVSTSGGVSSVINAGGPVAISAPGPVTSTISSGSTVELTSSTPIDVQINGGAVTVNAPGGQVGGVFGEITTGDGGTFVVNDQPVVGNGETDARQIIVDAFLAPVGGAVGAAGELVLPSGLSLALIAPQGIAASRPPVIVNSVERLGELLREGYTAIIIDLGQSGLADEQEELTAS